MNSVRRSQFTSVVTALLLLAVAGFYANNAWAHHSTARYDLKQQITVTGRVTRFDWTNPHVYVFVEQTTDSGQKVVWEIEGGPPSIMHRWGWSKDSLHGGETITVTGSPARNPQTKALFPSQIRQNDKVLLDMLAGYGQLTRSPGVPKAAAKGLNGTWTAVLVMRVMLQYANPDPSKLTSEGAAAFRRFDERTLNPGAQCIPKPAPQLMLSPDLKRITASESEVRIENELDGAVRTVHMNVATHAGSMPAVQGHSIGRWEGNTLVIDTTQFAINSTGNAIKVPSGPGKHLVERLTASPDGKALTYQYEVTDPDYLAVPMKGEVQWVFSPDATFAPAKCDLESARRFTRE